MDKEGRALRKKIVKTAGEIFRGIKPAIPAEWLKSDLTAAQLRVLLVVYTEGPSRMSSIASFMEVAVSTVTGIMDNLVKKGLVTRRADTEDRRLVICELSASGRETVNRLWSFGQYQIDKLLNGMSIDQLKMAEEVAGLILANVKNQNKAVSPGAT